MEYIVGGGITGLICSFYTGKTIISKDIGGQMNACSDWHLGPRYLHVDEYSTKLLKDLKIKARKKVINVGHCVDGEMVKKNAEFKEKYYKKTRRNGRTPIRSATSQGKISFLSYDIDIGIIIKALHEKVKNRIIDSNVKSISVDGNFLILDDGTKRHFDHLISTIPAPIFKRISGARMAEFKSLSKTFALVKKSFVPEYDFNFDYVYYAGFEPFSRASISDIKDHLVVEFTESDGDNFKCSFEDSKYIHIGQIQDSGSFTHNFKNISFMGRYACWKHNILTNDVIKQSLMMMKRDAKVKVCAIDLDGVLCEYPKKWVDYANEQLGTNYNLFELKDNIPFNQYRQIKSEYRRSGLKRTIPMIKDASEFIKRLKEKGYIVILLSARPVFKYPEVLNDTLEWLKDNDIFPDMHFWGSDKHIKIIKYFPDLQFMVEDDTKIANDIANNGYKVFLMDNEYNQQAITEGVKRVKGFSEVLKDV